MLNTTTTRTNLRGVGDLVVLERVEVVFDVDNRPLLEHPRAEERVGRALRRRAGLCGLALRGRGLTVPAVQLYILISTNPIKPGECYAQQGGSGQSWEWA